ncbi:polymorphic toxin type 30 domain-containing protein [Cellulosilyticum lentocellum]|uniref:Bacterial toxin 30 domain-containing protein n=1 Tax=Cellulosilyticum lentocellum (strain ATCC 49066 / DSM 5427 / NCIMB 11756 / RHM5) TaxID=642492 RepID=F2JHT4_CELLD|nr:polymorphic toxin type 30 domain-containing protein [Cellulosilyticum lentocellum]ADZ85426.1 hypothetical protein Clole_3746 [Cellulosilyticum lentocellum DSM 5427]
MQNKIVSDTEVIRELRGKIGDYTGYAARQYNTSCNSIIRQMDSLISKYNGEKYGGDVVAKARQIKEIANDILRYRTDFIKQSDKILDGLKFVVNQYNATEKECIGLVKQMALSKPSVRVMSKGIDNLQTLIKQNFTRENVEKLATLWENMLKEYNEARKEELKQLQERLASGNLPQLEDSDIAFYEAMPTMLSELGISLSTKDQANLLSCLRIKGEVESIDLKRFGLTPESGISEKELKKLSETITLKYDAEYYNKKNTEAFNQKLDLFNSFITDVNMNAVALGEATVDLGVDMAVGAYKIGVEPVGRLGELFAAWNLKNLGGMSQEEFDQKFNDYCNYADNLTSGLGSALVNVGNTNLEENTVLSPLYYTATGFNEYMQGNMTHEEKIAYFKKVIESVMIVEGGIKGVQKGSTIVKSKLEASKVKAGGVEGLNQVDELTKSRNTVVKEGAVKSGSSKVGDFKNLKGTTVDDILDRIPDDATLRELTPVKGGATEGFEFKWIQDNQTYRVRVHNIDPGAPVGSNASQGWIVRIQRGRQYYDYTIEGFQPAKYTNNPNGEFFDSTITNNTHIPIKDPYQ